MRHDLVIEAEMKIRESMADQRKQAEIGFGLQPDLMPTIAAVLANFLLTKKGSLSLEELTALASKFADQEKHTGEDIKTYMHKCLRYGRMTVKEYGRDKEYKLKASQAALQKGAQGAS
jgi:hypothetical protein